MQQMLNVVVAGTKMFEKDECEHCPCAYRVCMDGLPFLLPFLSDKRVVRLPRYLPPLSLCTCAGMAVEANGHPKVQVDSLGVARQVKWCCETSLDKPNADASSSVLCRLPSCHPRIEISVKLGVDRHGYLAMHTYTCIPIRG